MSPPRRVYLDGNSLGPERHLGDLAQPIPGWVGHADPFSMSEVHEPAAGIRRMLSGTPPVLGLAALDAALTAFDGVDMGVLRTRSLALTDRCIRRADELQLETVTPRDAESRGSQVSLRHEHAWGVVQALIAAGVIGDFRPPDLIRYGLAPLHTTLADVDEAMTRLAEVLRTQSWRQWLDADRPTVT